MSVDANVAAMRRWFDEVWNQGNYQVIHDVFAPDGRSHGTDEQPIVGPDAFVAFARQLRTAFPEMQLTIDEIFGVDDRVVVRWSALMAHQGEGLGIPATGRRVRTNGISIVHFRDGKAINAYDCWDRAGLMQQLTAPEAAAV